MPRSEETDQIMLMDWLHLFDREVWRVTHHSPNGGFRHIRTATRLKRLGTKAGFPDLFIPVQRGIYAGMVLELKAEKGAKPTPDQMGWLEHFASIKWHACWHKGFDSAQEAIKQYLNLKPGQSLGE